MGQSAMVLSAEEWGAFNASVVESCTCRLFWSMGGARDKV